MNVYFQDIVLKQPQAFLPNLRNSQLYQVDLFADVPSETRVIEISEILTEEVIQNLNKGTSATKLMNSNELVVYNKYQDMFDSLASTLLDELLQKTNADADRNFKNKMLEWFRLFVVKTYGKIEF
jgi:hypothetical protein